MVKKITITMPEKVHKKLESYRDRIPISSVCTEALKKAMDDIDSNVQAAKTRFLLLTFQEACEQAFEKGSFWAGHKATAQELAYLCEWNSNISKNTTFEMLYKSDYKIKELADDNEDIGDFMTNYELDGMLIYRFIDKSDVIVESFKRGAMSVWKEIKSQVIRELLKDESERTFL